VVTLKDNGPDDRTDGAMSGREPELRQYLSIGTIADVCVI